MDSSIKDLVPDVSKNYLHSSMGHPLTREWNCVDQFKKSDIIYPMFIHDNDEDRKQSIELLPDNYRYHHEDIVEILKPLYEKGLRSIMLFGVIPQDKKDKTGSGAENGPVNKAMVAIKKELKDMLIVCDLCLCPYTSHGHCGILDEDGEIINKKSVIRLGEIALNLIKDGADVIAPSDCMDCRIGYLKNLFRDQGLTTPVMSYGSKFCSGMYGPFRHACGSAPSFGDRSKYQLPIGSKDLAIRALERDVEEGADFIMVKPGIFYIDIINEIARKDLKRPIAAYQTSGEYAMLYYSAEKGIFDLDRILLENLTAYRRAGCDILLTYFAPKLLDLLS